MIRNILTTLFTALILLSSLALPAQADATPISSASFSPMSVYTYAADGNAVDNVPLPCTLNWVMLFTNNDISQTISQLNIAANATGIIVAKANPAATSVSGSNYTWSFQNIGPNRSVWIRLYEGWQFTIAPGYQSSRAVDKEIFMGPDEQTLNVTVTPLQSFYSISVRLFEGETSGETNLVTWQLIGGQPWLTTINPTVGQTYTYQFKLLVTPKIAGPVRFVPQAYAFGSILQSGSTYFDTCNVTAQATDMVGRTLRASATSAEIVGNFAAYGSRVTSIRYNLISCRTEYSAEDAMQKGLTWLVGQQQANGCWSPDYEPVADTALAVVKLEELAFEMGYPSPFDAAYPYRQNVINGLDYIFRQASAATVGICFAAGGHESYNSAIAMMAIAANRAPDRIVSVGNPVVDGRTYKQVLQANVDYFAWAQNPDGGWRYWASNQPSDNSNTGFVVLGLRYAEAALYGFECSIPAALKSRLSTWIDYVQNDPGPSDDFGLDRPDGGSGYMNAYYWVNLLKAGNLLFEMSFVGDTITTPRIQNAISYIERHWKDTNEDPGWQGNFMTMYCLMKGFESLDIDTITVDGSPVNWYDVIADSIYRLQASDDSWGWGGWGPIFAPLGTPVMNTEFALLSLERLAPPPPVNVVVEMPKCACNITGYQVKVNYTVERFIVNGTLNVYEDGILADTVNLTNFTGIGTYTRDIAAEAPGGHIWKGVLDVTPVGGGTPAQAEGQASINVCETPRVSGIPDQTAPFQSFDLDNFLTYSGGLPVVWTAKAPAGWTVNIDADNIATVIAPAGVTDPATITFTASVGCCTNVICSGSDDAVFTTNRPPDCSKAYADPGCLWSPNHEFVQVSVMGVTDPDGDPVTITITSITSDEPTASDEGSCGAYHAPDASGVGTSTALVRAERSGNGDGRVYVISFTASDGKGGVCEGSVAVKVPHNQSSKDCEAIDSGQNYDATQIN